MADGRMCITQENELHKPVTCHTVAMSGPAPFTNTKVIFGDCRQKDFISWNDRETGSGANIHPVAPFLRIVEALGEANGCCSTIVRLACEKDKRLETRHLNPPSKQH